MPKKKKKQKIIVEKNKGGRPTKYRKRFIKQAYEACADLGAREEDLAKLFSIKIPNLRGWRRKHPEFHKAIIQGKDLYDTENVEKTLLARAVGFYYDEVTTKDIKLKGKNRNGNVIYVPAIQTTTTRKFIPGDVRAIYFWLQNRNRIRWRNVKYVDVNVDEKKEVTKKILKVLAHIPKGQLEEIQERYKQILPVKTKQIEEKSGGT